MTTKRLAKELGLIRKRTTSSSSLTHTPASNQLFSYLIIIDFESTCWKEKNSYGQEIIEFPAVLMNTHTGLIESEFHSYVQPQEHPHLSSFCTELTGITQEQVEAGLPLQICLSRFTRWLHTLHQERDVVFLRDNTHTSTAGKPCAFLTWSDWDLGVCLQYECKRKQINKPNVLNSWIDLRATYRIYYQRKPKGLNGALQDLGIEFSGREHSGLDDARNTARLAWRMIRDGCMMKITKCVSRVQMKVCVRGVCKERKEKQLMDISNTHTETVCDPVTSSHSLVPQGTVLSCVTTTLTHTSHPQTSHTGTTHTSHTGTTHTSHPGTALTHTSHLSHTSPLLHTSHPDTLASDWLEEFVVTDFGDSGSYDDVILEDTSENLPHDSASPECKTKPRPLHSSPPSSIKYPIRSLTAGRTTPPIPFSIYTDQSHHSLSSSVFCVPSSYLSLTVNQSARPSVSVDQSACFSLPVDQSKLSSVSLNQSALSYISLNQSARSSYSINQSHASFSINQSSLSSSKHLPLPPPKGQTKVMSAFPNKSALFSSRSLNQSCHTTLSANQSASSTSSSKRLPLPPQKGGVKITSPLCDCGRRSRRLMVCNGGPNHGRGFYTCTKRRSSAPLPHNPTRRDSASHNNGCGFFKWESALIKHSEQNKNTAALSFYLRPSTSRNLR
ncbi:ERI1 exoribonuclease 2 [Silurus meridionalis]|uniref:ERI1 exoribonuclease 2 n=1 Tax=Silurus meridionalis TaxID=175797 RepID=A0A8T0ACP4_SILME|nr:ERI1 exoribonuclease 2 [Silurus meridionalis]KAF7689175.1 hypothetical protein HF521_012528 [Silurus meridionalis]